MQKSNITGMQMYYYFVCHRKLWYFTHEICMESENENVQIGKILDETSYQKHDKHIMIDNTINIDFMAEHNVLHEVKKSRSIEEAGIWQVKYYLYYLKKHGVDNLKGKIDYPLLKQSIVVELSDEDTINIEKALEGIINIINSPLPPEISRRKFCKSCAYYDFCLI